jgi:hypothetical protein
MYNAFYLVEIAFISIICFTLHEIKRGIVFFLGGRGATELSQVIKNTFRCNILLASY